MRIGKRCFVGNLAWRTSWQDLKDKFRDCGNVVYANVMRDDSGRSKGWGIVEFETPEEAVNAVNTMNGAEVDDRKILVREDREDRDLKGAGGESSGLQVVVQGIPWKYTWKELKDLFLATGEVERADVVYGNDGRSRGYGTVRFTTAEAAAEAVTQFHGSELEARTLTVFLDKYA